MPKSFKALALGLSLLWYAGVHAQPQPAPSPEGRGQEVIRGLGLIVEQSARMPSVTVIGVISGFAAEAAGVAPLDRVVRVGEHAISNIADLHNAMASVAPGARVEIVVQRGDGERTLRATPR